MSLSVLHRFWDIARYWSKSADVNLSGSHLYLTPPLGAMSFKGFSTRNVTLLRRAYVTYVICPSCSWVWFQCLKPHLLKHIDAFERVQHHFTKRITVLHNLSYEGRYAHLDLDTLECWRLKADLTLYSKIMHNLTRWPIDRYSNISVHARQTRLTESKTNFTSQLPFVVL